MSGTPEEPPAPEGTGVLLINLGTPEAPTPDAVRTYLRQFLSDRRVVEIPPLIWQPILRLFVLRTRPKASAERYAQVWMPEGSPLKVYTERQAALLQGYLGERLHGPIIVDYAMRYGQPPIAQKISAMQARGCARILLLPLYPQYSGSTTATAFDAAFAALARVRNQPEIRTVRDFHDDGGYIEALASSVRDYWSKRGEPNVLIMSFHGVPRRTVQLGDPYDRECATTARGLAAALGLGEDRYRITFQSRFGRAEWLKPYTSEVMTELGRAKTPRVDVVCPGFTSDCLETLEEIAIENKTFFLKAGGGEFHYIPCLNDRHEWISALADLAERHLRGWIERRPAGPADTRARPLARGMGA
ncbi:MAG: ferrochelatase [Burkholderiales bacterium]